MLPQTNEPPLLDNTASCDSVAYVSPYPAATAKKNGKENGYGYIKARNSDTF